METQNLNEERFSLADVKDVLNAPTVERAEDNSNTAVNTEVPTNDVQKESLFVDKGVDVNTNQVAANEDDNVYLSLAKALAENGVLSALSEEDIKNVTDINNLYGAMQKQVGSMLNEEQARVANALNANMQVSEIQQYENLISFLDGLSSDVLSKENDESETLRKNIIFQYFKELGQSDEMAHDMVERSIKAGKDIDDAMKYKDVLRDNYNRMYQSKIEEGKKLEQQNIDNILATKQKIESDENFFGNIKLSPQLRKQIADNWLTPAWRGSDNNVYTPIQRFINEKPEEYMKNIALFYTLTDGFQNYNKLSDFFMNKEKNKYTKELEEVLTNSHKYNKSGSFVNKNPNESRYRLG